MSSRNGTQVNWNYDGTLASASSDTFPATTKAGASGQQVTIQAFLGGENPSRCSILFTIQGMCSNLPMSPSLWLVHTAIKAPEAS
jgi:hypothetical protein